MKSQCDTRVVGLEMRTVSNLPAVGEVRNAFSLGIPHRDETDSRWAGGGSSCGLEDGKPFFD
jgi:hypothetical protein